jgi:hypothetical protein
LWCFHWKKYREGRITKLVFELHHVKTRHFFYEKWTNSMNNAQSRDISVWHFYNFPYQNHFIRIIYYLYDYGEHKKIYKNYYIIQLWYNFYMTN